MQRGCIACSSFALALPRFTMPSHCFFWEPFFFSPFPFQLLCGNRSESGMYRERRKRAKLSLMRGIRILSLRRFWVFGLSDSLLFWFFLAPRASIPDVFFCCCCKTMSNRNKRANLESLFRRSALPV
uniref:Uncharacterized protein n=1 Tax=Ixodes scapularis TaxID=6945 RepID=A0A4D5RX59_IXOSC